MRIFAIGDLHLSGANSKPMDIFGENWINHWEKIKTDWNDKVKDDDYVLIPGDISWALTFDEAMADILAIAEMPGRIILSRGNHDYWWSSLSKMRKVFPDNIQVIQNDYIEAGEYLICGTRGWILPGDERFGEEDGKIYSRELIRLGLSLSKAEGFSKKPVIVMLHYPPFNEKGEISDFMSLMGKYNVAICIYGHLHGEGLRNVREGEFEGIRYCMVSCDYLNFKLREIIRL